MNTHRRWPGYFITLEGGEGAGKSTQCRLLGDRLRALGYAATVTREPGGVPQGEELRALLLSGAKDRWSPVSEALMMYAARVEHWRLKIEPALRAGEWVICDRFADSSMAYQGIAGGLGRARIEALHRLTLGDVQPDLTFILDIPAEAGLKRAADRVAAQGEGATRFEQKDAQYHLALSQAFRDIAAWSPDRCRIIPADGPIADIAKAIWSDITGRFGIAE